MRRRVLKHLKIGAYHLLSLGMLVRALVFAAIGAHAQSMRMNETMTLSSLRIVVQQRERVNAEHRISKMLDRSQFLSKELLTMYEDAA